MKIQDFKKKIYLDKNFIFMITNRETKFSKYQISSKINPVGIKSNHQNELTKNSLNIHWDFNLNWKIEITFRVDSLRRL